MLKGRFLPAYVAFLAAGSLAAAGSFVRADDKPWMTDIEAAKAKAKAEKKLLLLEFTGSDWCGVCIMMEKAVFEKDEFKAGARKRFVLVRLDYPRQAQLPEDLQRQNQRLRQLCKIRGFPTSVIMDPEEKILAQKIGAEQNVGNYLKLINGFADSYEAIARLQKQLPGLKGVERAKVLDQLVEAWLSLEHSDAELLAWSKEVAALDADNAAGVGTKHAVRFALGECRNLREAKKCEEAKAVVEKVFSLPGVTGLQKQDGYMAQAEVCEVQQLFPEALALAKKAIAADAEHAGKHKGKLARLEKLVAAQATIARLKPELDKAKGLDRVKILDQLVEAQDQIDRGAAEAWVKEIISLDPDNKSGLKVKHEFRVLMAEAETAFNANKFGEARSAATKAAALPGLNKSQIFNANMMVGMTYSMVRDEHCVDYFRKALDADPANPRAHIAIMIINMVNESKKSSEKKPAEKKPANKENGR